MAVVLRFIVWLGGLIWKYGAIVIARVIAWVRANAGRVQKWLERGIAWGTILQWILQLLGLG